MAYMVDSDSDDEMLMNVALRGRNVKNHRPRVDHFTEWTDEEFFIRFRLTKPTVLQLLGLVEDDLETKTDRSLSPINQLLLTLRFYAQGNFLISAGDFCGVSKSTASVIIKKVSAVIASLAPTFISLPRTEEELREGQLEFFLMYRFPQVLAAMDCTHIRIQSPGGGDAETFRNRKSWFSLNVQTLSDAKMRITDIVVRWPGSTHDQTIFNNSRIKARLEAGEFGDALVLGDSGYGVTPYLITPLRNPVLPEEHLFNEAQIRTRGIVERQYGTWKRRFPVLSLGMRLKLETCQDVIVACAVLHNIAINAKEEEPPIDPDCRVPEEDVDDQQIPVPPNPRQAGHQPNNNVQRRLVERFRNMQ